MGRSEQVRIGLGRVFQREGAATLKALSPQVQCLVMGGSDRRFVSEERRQRLGEWGSRRSVR